jgi:hypothetical protein
MENEGLGYTYLGVPEQLAGVLWSTVHDMQTNLAAENGAPWAQLASATLSRCVLHFASLTREHGFGDTRPEIACTEVFHRFARQLLEDGTAEEWAVPSYMMPVVAGTVAACGDLVADRVTACS